RLVVRLEGIVKLSPLSVGVSSRCVLSGRLAPEPPEEKREEAHRRGLRLGEARSPKRRCITWRAGPQAVGHGHNQQSARRCFFKGFVATFALMIRPGHRLPTIYGGSWCLTGGPT